MAMGQRAAQSSAKLADSRFIQPEIFRDFRGEFVETFSVRSYQFTDQAGNLLEFVEDNISISRRNVLRGLHGDRKTWKLVQCVYGAVYYVVADLRPDSATYLQWESFAINDRNRIQILVPAGCANGYLCLSEECVFTYKQSHYYSGAENQFTVRWDDPALNIYWPIQSPSLSQRDSTAKNIEVSK